jgi:1-deoxy-D-xylulose-5-phosphate reductoisomerase
MSRRIRIAVLGSTGSIGRQALQVAAAHPGRVEVVALAAHSNATLIAEQARTFGVREIAVADSHAARTARNALAGLAAVADGPAAVVALAEHPDVDVVLNALVGAAGLRATLAALRAGKVLALANKESLVVGGDLVM